MDKRLTRDQAIVTASRYNYAREVAYVIDHYNMTPEEALSEYDIL